MISDPLAAMYAAVEAVSRGDSNEIELEWTDRNEDTRVEERLTIYVRREVKHFQVKPPEDMP